MPKDLSKLTVKVNCCAIKGDSRGNLEYYSAKTISVGSQQKIKENNKRSIEEMENDRIV